jgi:hypothetical protein
MPGKDYIDNRNWLAAGEVLYKLPQAETTCKYSATLKKVLLLG